MRIEDKQPLAQTKKPGASNRLSGLWLYGVLTILAGLALIFTVGTGT